MRKCIFTERVRINGGLGKPDIHSETKTEGTFTGWGIDFFESDVGSASFTAGIIELPDGHIKLIRADDIQFLPEPVVVESPYINGNCGNCKHSELNQIMEPCATCIDGYCFLNWQPKP